MVTEGYQYWPSPIWCISTFTHKFFYAYLLSLVKLRLVVGTHKVVEIISRIIWYLDNSVSPSSSLIPLNSRLLSRSQSSNLPSFLFSS